MELRARHYQYLQQLRTDLTQQITETAKNIKKLLLHQITAQGKEKYFACHNFTVDITAIYSVHP